MYYLNAKIYINISTDVEPYYISKLYRLVNSKRTFCHICVACVAYLKTPVLSNMCFEVCDAGYIFVKIRVKKKLKLFKF